MAVKRSFSTTNPKHCICLKCGERILPENLHDNSVYTCDKCGQKMTVDRYESRAVLTVIERQDLRRRIPSEVMNAAPQQKGRIAEILQENEDLKNRLNVANTTIAELRQAADGLARMIEEMKADKIESDDTN